MEKTKLIEELKDIIHQSIEDAIEEYRYNLDALDLNEEHNSQNELLNLVEEKVQEAVAEFIENMNEDEEIEN